METAKKYGVLVNRGGNVMASRNTFLIDPSGKIAKFYDVTPDKLPGHSAELLTDIAAMKAAPEEGADPSRLIDACWRPGPGFTPAGSSRRRARAPEGDDQATPR